MDSGESRNDGRGRHDAAHLFGEVGSLFFLVHHPCKKLRDDSCTNWESDFLASGRTYAVVAATGSRRTDLMALTCSIKRSKFWKVRD